MAKIALSQAKRAIDTANSCSKGNISMREFGNGSKEIHIGKITIGIRANGTVWASQ